MRRSKGAGIGPKHAREDPNARPMHAALVKRAIAEARISNREWAAQNERLVATQAAMHTARQHAVATGAHLIPKNAIKVNPKVDILGLLVRDKLLVLDDETTRNSPLVVAVKMLIERSALDRGAIKIRAEIDDASYVELTREPSRAKKMQLMLHDADAPPQEIRAVGQIDW